MTPKGLRAGEENLPGADVPSAAVGLASETGTNSVIDSRERYSRQVLFPGIGPAGQEKLGRSCAAIVGVGATGAAAASLLARAGVGRLILIDRDFVEPSNLQRQVLFDERDALDALPKAEAARRHLRAINAEIAVTPHVADLVPGNAEALLAGAEIVLDGTDNFETRYVLNELCVRDGRPWIYTAAIGAYAATMNILPRLHERLGDCLGETTPPPAWSLLAASTACLACLFSAAPVGEVDTCETAGVLGTAVNLAASVAVTEALKFLTGQPQAMRRTLLSHDLWSGDRSEVSSSHPRPGCSVCEKREFPALRGEGRPHVTLCGRNSVQIHEHHRPLDLTQLKLRLERLGEVRANGLLLRFHYTPYTLTVFPDGRALIQGTTDVGLARSLYARFVGS